MHANSPSPAPASSLPANVKPSPPVSSDMKEAEYNGYPYSYKREGDTTVAMFVKRFFIRVDGAENGYIVVPVKEDTGEIHSLTITRVAR